MSESMIAPSDSSIIIGELRADSFCIVTRAGSVRGVSMHVPIAQRAQFLHDLFCGETVHPPSVMEDVFDQHIDCAVQGYAGYCNAGK